MARQERDEKRRKIQSETDLDRALGGREDQQKLKISLISRWEILP